MKNIKVTEIMTKEIISVKPETPLLEAAHLLTSHNFNGLPVVNEDNSLAGIVTEYDLISPSSDIHLPTLQKVLGSLPVFRKDKSEFSEDIEELNKLTVRDVMNTDPLTLNADASFQEALTAFREHHRVNPIPIVDQNKKIQGVLSRFDILKPLTELS